MWARLRNKLRYLVGRDRIDRELAEEMDFHRRMLERDQARAGLGRDEAARAARRQLGNATAATEYARDAWVIAWVEALLRDLQYAVRRLRRAPVFAAFGIVTLALGIGAATGVYSVVRAVTGPVSGVRNINRIVDVHPAAGRSPWSVSVPDYEDLRASQTTFDALTAWARIFAAFAADGRSGTAFGEIVAGNYFSVLGVNPARGRLLLPGDDRPDAPAVAVLGYGTWQRVFGGAEDVVGHVMKVNGHAFQVVGVAAPEFHGLFLNGLSSSALWVPLAAASDLSSPGRRFDPRDRDSRWLAIKALLKPDRTLTEARAEVEGVGKRLDAAMSIGPGPNPATTSRVPSRAWTATAMDDAGADESFGAPVRGVVAMIMMAVGVLLLVACTNLANLTLARGTGRREEFAVRLALGSSRARLVREALLESAVLAVAGGVLGLGVARVIVVLLSGELAVNGAPLTLHLDARLDFSALVVCMLAIALALGVAGLGPAWQSTRADLRSALVSGGAHGAGPRWRSRRVLIAGQVCASVILLTLAAFCLIQLRANQRDPGFALTDLAVADVEFGIQGYDDARVARIVTAFLDRMSARPETASFSVASGLPMGITSSRRGSVGGDDARDPVFASVIAGGPNLLKTLDVPIIHGRAWDARDSLGAPLAVLSALTARKIFGTTDVVGRTVRMQIGGNDQPIETRLVIGVAADTIDISSLTQPNKDLAYVPYGHDYGTRVVFLARATGDPVVLAGVVRDVLRGIDRDLAPTMSGSGPSVVGSTLQFFQFSTEFATMLGTFAWVLALAGLYGVLSHLVLRRTREIGLRVALGASRRDIITMVVRQGLSPVAVGVLAGVILGAIVRGALQPFFRQAMPLVDLIGLTAVPVLFLAAAVLACYLPARRAAGVDPNVALRQA